MKKFTECYWNCWFLSQYRQARKILGI